MPDITIPRPPGMRAERHAALVDYLTAGADRSLDATARKLTKSTRLLKRWSVADGWQDRAREYDSTLARMAAQAHAAQYQAEVEAFRADAVKHGGELIALGRTLAAEVAKRRDRMEYKPSDLATAVKALVAGFDLRALGLDLPRLLAMLEDAPPDD